MFDFFFFLLMKEMNVRVFFVGAKTFLLVDLNEFFSLFSWKSVVRTRTVGIHIGGMVTPKNPITLLQRVFYCFYYKYYWFLKAIFL